MNEVTIYTDGACSGNPGPGGWAALLFFGEKDIAGQPQTKQLADGAPHTTNNKMELTAALEALEALENPSRVRLHTDSQYLAKAFNQGWLANWQKNGWKTSAKKPVKNKTLWQKLLKAAGQHEVEWIWVKGHADNEYNIIADEMAVSAMERFK